MVSSSELTFISLGFEVASGASFVKAVVLHRFVFKDLELLSRVQACQVCVMAIPTGEVRYIKDRNPGSGSATCFLKPFVMFV